MRETKLKRSASQISWAKEFLEMGLTGEWNLKVDEYRKSLIEEFGTDQLDKVIYDEKTDQYKIVN